MGEETRRHITLHSNTGQDKVVASAQE